MDELKRIELLKRIKAFIDVDGPTPVGRGGLDELAAICADLVEARFGVAGGALPVSVLMYDSNSEWLPWDIPVELATEDETSEKREERQSRNLRVCVGALGTYTREIERIQNEMDDAILRRAVLAAAKPVDIVYWAKRDNHPAPVTIFPYTPLGHPIPPEIQARINELTDGPEQMKFLCLEAGWVVPHKDKLDRFDKAVEKCIGQVTQLHNPSRGFSITETKPS